LVEIGVGHFEGLSPNFRGNVTGVVHNDCSALPDEKHLCAFFVWPDRVGHSKCNCRHTLALSVGLRIVRLLAVDWRRVNVSDAHRPPLGELQNKKR